MDVQEHKQESYRNLGKEGNWSAATSSPSAKIQNLITLTRRNSSGSHCFAQKGLQGKNRERLLQLGGGRGGLAADGIKVGDSA